MRLWQFDFVGGVFLVNGREHKILTAIDDHSRFVVAATVVPPPSRPAVCDAFLAAITRCGAPFEMLTDNGEQFTGRFTRPLLVEVLLERICREDAIAARLTTRRSPTTTGKAERFHRALRRELLDETGQSNRSRQCDRRMGTPVHHRTASAITERGHPSEPVR